MKRQRASLLALCGLLAGFAAAGCGEKYTPPPKFPVSGEVTFQGNPVTEGMITFYRQDGAGTSAVLDGAGKFVVDTGLQEGQYRVYVEPPPVILTPPPAGGPPTTPPPQHPNIPEKYRQAATSGLLATVEPKKEGNTFTFDMTP